MTNHRRTELRSIMVSAWSAKRADASRTFASCLRAAWKFSKRMDKALRKLMKQAKANGGHEVDQSTWCVAPSERQAWSVMDGEPSLTSVEQIDQRRWCDGARDDREHASPETRAMFDAPANGNRQ